MLGMPFTLEIQAPHNVARLKAIPSCVGLESEKIRLERISAVKSSRLVQVIADLTE